MNIIRVVVLSVLFVVLLSFGVSVSAEPESGPYPYKDIGDGKKASEVVLTLVDGIAVDTEGNLFISHRSKNRIRKVDKDGVITTIAGNGRAGYSVGGWSGG